MTNRPTAYLVDQYKKPESVVLAAEMAKISIAGAEFTPLFKRDDIAPLQVPLIDQHGKTVGTHHRRPSELMTETAYRDADGVIWTSPTAFAYAAVCEARHKADMELGRARMALAELLDELAASVSQDGGKISPAAALAANRAEAFLNETDRSRITKETAA